LVSEDWAELLEMPLLEGYVFKLFEERTDLLVRADGAAVPVLVERLEGVVFTTLLVESLLLLDLREDEDRKVDFFNPPGLFPEA
jgi:hypothetical protein